MRKYSAKELTKYAEKAGYDSPEVWYSRMDGWWMETASDEVYLGADSVGAKRKLDELIKNKK